MVFAREHVPSIRMSPIFKMCIRDREYLEKMGFGNQPYLVFKHEDIDRHHLHIVTVRVDENGRGCLLYTSRCV